MQNTVPLCEQAGALLLRLCLETVEGQLDCSTCTTLLHPHSLITSPFPVFFFVAKASCVLARGQPFYAGVIAGVQPSLLCVAHISIT